MKKKSFLKNNLQIQGVKEIEFNITQFQKNDTNTCGKFALYFIINRLFNMDYCFSDFLEEIFEEDLNKNEEKVNEFYNELSQNFSDSEML